MPSVRQLERRRDALLRRKNVADKKSQLKSEIRNLKYGTVFSGLKVAGRGLAAGGKAIGGAAVRYGEYYNRNESKSKKRKSNYSFGGSVM